MRFPAVACALLLLPASLAAQHRDVGLTAGVNIPIGTMCGPFDCAPIQGNVPGGTDLTVAVYSAPGFPFAILASAGANRCLPIPGILHGLVLDDPLFVLAAGPSNPPIAGLCPKQSSVFMGGISTRILLPAIQGISFSMQAFGFAGNDPTDAVPAVSRGLTLTLL